MRRPVKAGARALFFGDDHVEYATRGSDASVKLFEALGLP